MGHARCLGALWSALTVAIDGSENEARRRHRESDVSTAVRDRVARRIDNRRAQKRNVRAVQVDCRTGARGVRWSVARETQGYRSAPRLTRVRRKDCPRRGQRSDRDVARGVVDGVPGDVRKWTHRDAPALSCAVHVELHKRGVRVRVQLARIPTAAGGRPRFNKANGRCRCCGVQRRATGIRRRHVAEPPRTEPEGRRLRNAAHIEGAKGGGDVGPVPGLADVVVKLQQWC